MGVNREVVDGFTGGWVQEGVRDPLLVLTPAIATSLCSPHPFRPKTFPLTSVQLLLGIVYTHSRFPHHITGIPGDSAGRVMNSEFLSFPSSASISLSPFPFISHPFPCSRVSVAWREVVQQFIGPFIFKCSITFSVCASS